MTIERLATLIREAEEFFQQRMELADCNLEEAEADWDKIWQEGHSLAWAQALARIRAIRKELEAVEMQ